jgi:hypothetical protein
MSPLQPPVRNRLLAPERRRIPGEPEGHPRCPQAIVALTIDAIRAFADVEHDVGQIEPPGGEPQTFERLGIFLGLQRLFEREAGRCQSPRPSAARPVSRPLIDRRDEFAAGGLSLHGGGPAQITSTDKTMGRIGPVLRLRERLRVDASRRPRIRQPTRQRQVAQCM